MLLSLLTIVLTAAYCAFVWLGLPLYAIWLPATIARELSLVARGMVGIAIPYPWHALPWQLPALLSLAWVLLGGRSQGDAAQWPLERRAIAHLLGVVTLICLMGVAMILPLVEIVQVLRH